MRRKLVVGAAEQGAALSEPATQNRSLVSAFCHLFVRALSLSHNGVHKGSPERVRARLALNETPALVSNFQEGLDTNLFPISAVSQTRKQSRRAGAHFSPLYEFVLSCKIQFRRPSSVLALKEPFGISRNERLLKFMVSATERIPFV